MAKQGIIVTGDKQLDRVLANLEPKMQKKHIKKATREVAKQVMARARQLTPVKTGALAASYQVRATTKNITVNTGRVSSKGFQIKSTVAQQFGAKVEVTRKTYAKQVQKRGGSYAVDAEYFPPAHIELGTKTTKPHPSMRTALKSLSEKARGMFVVELRKLIANPK